MVRLHSMERLSINDAFRHIYKHTADTPRRVAEYVWKIRRLERCGEEMPLSQEQVQGAMGERYCTCVTCDIALRDETRNMARESGL